MRLSTPLHTVAAVTWPTFDRNQWKGLCRNGWLFWRGIRTRGLPHESPTLQRGSASPLLEARDCEADSYGRRGTSGSM